MRSAVGGLVTEEGPKSPDKAYSRDGSARSQVYLARGRYGVRSGVVALKQEVGSKANQTPAVPNHGTTFRRGNRELQRRGDKAITVCTATR